MNNLQLHGSLIRSNNKAGLPELYKFFLDKHPGMVNDLTLSLIQHLDEVNGLEKHLTNALLSFHLYTINESRGKGCIDELSKVLIVNMQKFWGLYLTTLNE